MYSISSVHQWSSDSAAIRLLNRSNPTRIRELSLCLQTQHSQPPESPQTHLMRWQWYVFRLLHTYLYTPCHHRSHAELLRPSEKVITLDDTFMTHFRGNHDLCAVIMSFVTIVCTRKIKKVTMIMIVIIWEANAPIRGVIHRKNLHCNSQCLEVLIGAWQSGWWGGGAVNNFRFHVSRRCLALAGKSGCLRKFSFRRDMCYYGCLPVGAWHDRPVVGIGDIEQQYE